MVETLYEQCAIREPGERVVEGTVPGLLRGELEIGSCLGVGEVDGGDIGQRMGRLHRLGVHRAGRLTVQIKSAQPVILVAEREAEHRPQALVERPTGEAGERLFQPEVGDGHGLARAVRRDARPLSQLGLQLHEP